MGISQDSTSSLAIPPLRPPSPQHDKLLRFSERASSPETFPQKKLKQFNRQDRGSKIKIKLISKINRAM